MLRMVGGIHCNDPCISSEVDFFGWPNMLTLQGETIKTIKLANHFLTEFLTIDEVRVLVVNPCCFQNVCGGKVLKLHVNPINLKGGKDAVLNTIHLVRRGKSETDNRIGARSGVFRKFDVDGQLL